MPKITTLTAEPDDSQHLILKIVLSLLITVGLGIGGFMWFSTAGNEKKAEELYAKAKDACEHDMFDTCISRINEAIALKEKASYYELKFSALDSQDKPHESQQVVEKLLQLNPKNAHYYFLMHHYAELDGDTALALQNMDKAIQLQPDNGDYQITKATILVNQGRQPEALPIYKKLIAEQPQYYHFWDQYAMSYAINEQWAPALQIRLRGLKLNPNDFMQHFGLAELYDHMKRPTDAVKEYRRSLELHPLADSIAAKRIYELTGKRVPPSLENATSDSLPLEFHANLSYITADINGHQGRFLLDTGASTSIVFKSKISEYHLKPLAQVILAETANGFTQAPLAYGSMRLGRHDIENVRFAVLRDFSNPNLDGIIGMDVLGLFRFEIDRDHGHLTLLSQ